MTTDNPTNPASASERAALREAIAARNAAKAKVRVASEAADRGKQLLSAAKGKLTAFGDVDAEIVSYRASTFKAAAKGCGPKPTVTLPPDLLAKERARDEASSEVAAARAAHTSLVGELAEAQAALRKADIKVSELAAQVLVAETVERGSALTAIWNELWATVDSLKGLSSSGVQLPRGIVRVLQSFEAKDYRQFPGGRNGQLARALSYWKAYRAALCNSADATEPQPIDGDEPPAAERAAQFLDFGAARLPSVLLSAGARQVRRVPR